MTSHGQRLKNWARDPLWLLWAGSLLASALGSSLEVFGVVNPSEQAFSLISRALEILFWLPLILSAVRGRSLGSRNEMALEARFGYLALGTIMVVFTLETLAGSIVPVLAA